MIFLSLEEASSHEKMPISGEVWEERRMPAANDLARPVERGHGENETSVVLEMRNITKAFPGVLALDGMNLKVRAGTVHVLVGENGAGKSTLMKILSGTYSIDGGEIVFKGETLSAQDTSAALERATPAVPCRLEAVSSCRWNG